MRIQANRRSRTTAVVAASVAVVLLLLLLFMLRSRLASGSGAAQPPDVFSILFTCDTQGHIEPCGCASGMAGGISRRQTYLAQNRPADFLLVDAGDVTAGPREWEMLEFEYILKGYDVMGYHAVNLGHRELSLGLEGLRQISRQYERFVSANVLDADGDCVVEPYRVVELSNGYRCGIIGVVDDRLDPDQVGTALRLASPADALAKYLPQVKKEADFIILLAFVDEAQMRALADQFFELDVIVGGKVRQTTTEPVLANRSAIVFNTDKGKNVGRLDIRHPKRRPRLYAGTVAVLEESMARDPRIAALVEQYKEQLKLRDFRPVKDDEEGLSSISAARSKAANRYAGPASCRECHKAEYATWAQSKHAHAFETLEEQGHQYNPRCLKCHTVGYMASDGYINEQLTAPLKHVSCEACHGRGAHHVKLASGEDIPGRRAVMKVPRCLTCHDEENSPQFDGNRYWEQIAHGNQ